METNFKVDTPSFALGYSAGKSKGGSGGGVELNIAYGDAPPEDTSKLWVKTEKKPHKVIMSPTYATESGEASMGNDDGKITVIPQTIPKTVRQCGCAVVGRYLYIFGGIGFNNSVSSNIYRFDTETYEIYKYDNSTKLPFSGGCVAVPYGNKIYILSSGSQAKKTIACFDTETEEIKTMSGELPGWVYYLPCGLYGSAIYMKTSKAISWYDIEKDATSTVSTTFSQTIDNSYGCVSGDKLFVMSGKINNSPNANNVAYYSISAEYSAHEEGRLPFGIQQAPCCAVGKYVYIFGGLVGGDQINSIIRFDAETFASEVLATELPVSNCDMGICSKGTSIYLVGGLAAVDNNNKFVNYIWKFDTVSNCLVEYGAIDIITDHAGSKWMPINTDTVKTGDIGVVGVYEGDADGVGKVVDAYTYKNGAWSNV